MLKSQPKGSIWGAEIYAPRIYVSLAVYLDLTHGYLGQAPHT